MTETENLAQKKITEVNLFLSINNSKISASSQLLPPHAFIIIHNKIYVCGMDSRYGSESKRLQKFWNAQRTVKTRFLKGPKSSMSKLPLIFRNKFCYIFMKINVNSQFHFSKKNPDFFP